MKLINGNELIALIEKEIQSDVFCDKGTFKSMIKDCLVDPAELELGVLGMWEKLKTVTRTAWEKYQQVEDEILLKDMAKLESGLALKPLRETLVQAKAWKIAIRDNWLAHSGIEELLAQARAEIEAKGKEKGERRKERIGLRFAQNVVQRFLSMRY